VERTLRILYLAHNRTDAEEGHQTAETNARRGGAAENEPRRVACLGPGGSDLLLSAYRLPGFGG